MEERFSSSRGSTRVNRSEASRLKMRLSFVDEVLRDAGVDVFPFAWSEIVLSRCRNSFVEAQPKTLKSFDSDVVDVVAVVVVVTVVFTFHGLTIKRPFWTREFFISTSNRSEVNRTILCRDSRSRGSGYGGSIKFVGRSVAPSARSNEKRLDE